MSPFDRYQYLELGSAPVEEELEQVGPDCNYQKMFMEVQIFKKQLERQFPPPKGAKFVVKSQQHDFGKYYEVCIKFEAGDEEQSDWAFSVEADLPENWDEQSLRELKQFENEK